MTDPKETRKSQLLEAMRHELSGGGNGEDLGQYAQALFRHAAAEDIVPYSAEELAAFARTSWNDFATRAPATPRIQVFNPDFATSATRHHHVTVIEVVNDNMPFLVDSIMGEVQDSGLDVHLMVHPIANVERDAAGALVSSQAKGERTTKESIVHIHVARIVSAEVRSGLAQRLDDVARNVRLAVNDWQPMRTRLAEAVDGYRRTPPPGVSGEELEEAIEFLDWLQDDNFTFLGMRVYRFEGGVEAGALTREQGTGLGVLTDPGVYVLRKGREFVVMTPEIREFLLRPQPLIISKANVKSQVHRRTHMDYIGVKLFEEDGRLAGELRIVGLFAATIYTESVRTIPYLGRKVERCLATAGYDPHSHSGRALANILEAYPRDELFQVNDALLLENADAILQLLERPRIRILPRRDEFDRFVSILAFLPRDRYNTDVRIRIGDYFAGIYEGRVSAWYVTYPEGPLVRVHFIIGHYEGTTPDPDREELESAVAGIVRTWADDLHAALDKVYEPEEARTVANRYQEAFQAGYKEAFDASTALADIAIIEALSPANHTAIDFYRRESDGDHRVSLKVYHHETPIPLSARVPMLENMGFRVINERTYRITPAQGQMSYLHDLTLDSRFEAPLDLHDDLLRRLEGLFMAVWSDTAESDGYNALVLSANLGWRDIAMLRALSRYLRQIRVRYSEDYMWGTLGRYPAVAAKLVELFHTRFDPGHSDADASLSAARIEHEIMAALDDVSSLDDDRILRHFMAVIAAMLRTNFHQPTAQREPGDADVPVFAFKVDPHRIEGMPQPRPFREIFVYSPRVEGLHLRFGKVARGGLRWSDRPQDFRTEVLGLVKAQQVKNAVIVPVGAKGGFVPKWLPAGGTREEIFAEGTAAYKIFVSTLLDITDNLDGDTVVPPPDVIRHDDDDPYLVVAADKGTATFSDTANAISEAHGFWLGDAFASGGSAGYDHKKMGITARGAWEAVKRHFREMDIDIQTTPFTVVGVGDMSGDVFGNGMLLSEQIRLIAAFDHRDIFIDPDPDAALSFAERKRLFEMGRSSWQDYDATKISEGGGVFSRQAKSIDLSLQAQAALGLSKPRAAPSEIMSAILRAKADLLWFGGIGTYVRATTETDADAGDRANDAIRVTAKELNCKVIGEGANLGVTQKARIEYARKGGRCNSDAIDNSAGVNSSDMEVNIKIALGAAVRSGRLTIPARNELLASMTDEVADLVLRNNYLQTLAISLSSLRGMEDFGYQARMMRQLESQGLLDRSVEYLPDDLTLEDMAKTGTTLTRPEIAVLLAYAKLTLHDVLLSSGVPDDAYLGQELFRYFPPEMQERYHEEISGHRLRRDIISTMLANSIINRGGPTFLTRIGDQTGADAAQIAQAFAAVRGSYRLITLNGEIDELDAKVPGTTQLELYSAVQDLVHDQTVWFLREISFGEGIEAVIGRFQAGIALLSPRLPDILPDALRTRIAKQGREWEQAGVPASLANRIARLGVDMMIPNIILIAEHAGRAPEEVAPVFFDVSSTFRIGRIDALAQDLRISDYYDGLALDRARSTLAAAHRRITAEVLKSADGKIDQAMDTWVAARKEDVTRTTRAVTEITETDALTVSKFSVAASLLGDLARG
ncbi:glutamate dehydrogenase (NAD) [Breoghania corrubedonensis]|uniref:Glutamate dehydrogenase (NAD) n=1 Tax=Breoghania corrubedonensis TaxID=665038 RepID=A0A2T5VAW9_9HYPH|nr:NAD-glutamate dehydrogenase [Breoghania corrubedonensis]PTW60894.1 glutamate dehydrogenase (NAD) [Breoghania corrubedonensis]